MARLAFLGTPVIAVPSLEALVDAGHEIVLVVSRPDARRGRGKGLTPSPVKEAALRLGLPVTDQLDEVAHCGAELGVVVAYGRIIPTALLEEVPMVNIHFSLLPRWRGAAPLERAILSGDEETGVCLMAVAPELDTGGIFAVERTPIEDKTLAELQAELAERGASLLVSSLADGVGSLGHPEDQSGEVTYAAKISPAEHELSVDGSREAALRAIRLGRAYTTLGAKRVRILEARRASEAASRPAGTLDGVPLWLADGGIELVVVQPESRSAMPAQDWRRGLGSAPLTLGSPEPANAEGT